MLHNRQCIPSNREWVLEDTLVRIILIDDLTILADLLLA